MAADNKIEIGVEVEQTGQGIDGVRRKVSDGARATGREVEQAFDRASSATAQAFDGLSSKVGSSFNRVAGEARSMWDRIGQEARQGADQAGTKAGATFTESIKERMDKVDFQSIGGNISEGLSALGSAGGPIGLAATGIGVAFADDLAAGFTRGFEGDKRGMALQIQTGLSAVETGPIGAAAGKAYAKGFGDNLQDLSASAATLDNVLSDIDPSLSLQNATRWAGVLEDHFAVEIPRSAEIAGRMIHQGLAESTEDAYDVMIGASQRYRVAYDEILDVTREFGTTFSELKISGAQAADFVGQAWTRGLVPTIDRAGELFEEFVIEVQAGATGRAAPAIENLGLSVAKVQDAISNGRGGQAMQQLAEELLKVEDISYRNELAVQIFGTAIESAADKQAVLELIAALDELGAGFDGAAEDSAQMAEEMRSEFDVLKRDIESFASDAGSNFAEFYEQMKFPERMWDRLKADTDEFLGWFGVETNFAIDTTATWVDTISRLQGMMTRDNFGPAAEGIGGVGEALDLAADSARDLDLAFADLQGRFDGDQAIRNLHDTIRELQAAELDTTGVTYDLKTGFDQTSVSGGAWAEMLEGLHGDLVAVAEAEKDGTAEAGSFARAQEAAEDQTRLVAEALNLNQAEAQALVDEYATLEGVPDIITYADLEGNAYDRTRELIQRLRGIDGYYATSTVDTHTINRTTYRTTYANGYRAAGGPVAGGLAAGGMSMATVNEGGGMAGAESAWLPNGNTVLLPTGSQVRSAEDTQRMVQAGQFGGGGREPIVIEINSAGSRIDDFLVELLRGAISARSGDVQIELGRPR